MGCDDSYSGLAAARRRLLAAGSEYLGGGRGEPEGDTSWRLPLKDHVWIVNAADPCPLTALMPYPEPQGSRGSSAAETQPHQSGDTSAIIFGMVAAVIAGLCFALAAGWGVMDLVFTRLQDFPLGPASGVGQDYRRSVEQNVSAQRRLAQRWHRLWPAAAVLAGAGVVATVLAIAT